jgi:hypothetical protein
MRPERRWVLRFLPCVKAALAKSATVHSTALCPEHPMLDIALLAIGLAFFALSVGYVVACDRL